MNQAMAWVGGRLASGLEDLTDDPGALDSTGFWAVVATFEGAVLCARFRHVADAAPPGGPWPGVTGSRWASSLDQAAFGKGVEVIRDAIEAGEVYQVNLCRVLSTVAPGADIVALGSHLARHHRAPHAATIWIPERGVAIASASPELFVSRRGRTVTSRPIKGTAGPGRRFLAKDRAENVMIVDLVRNDLGRVCEWGTVVVPQLCAVEAHPGLAHLVSTVAGELRPGAGWADLLGAAFPPGSVSGAPKRAALDMIDRLEPVPRGAYCGAIGWVDADRGAGALNVGIRTFWRDGDRLCFGTGAGITWDSTPDGEWAETELKARRLIALAGEASRRQPARPTRAPRSPRC